MSDTTLALVLSVATLVALLVWVPLLQSLEALARFRTSGQLIEMTNLVEEDSGPQFTGEVA